MPLGAEPHQGTGRGQGTRGPRSATVTSKSGSRMMTRHGGSDFSLGPCTELPPLWGPLSSSQKPLAWVRINDQVPSQTGKLRTEGSPRSHSWRGNGRAGIGLAVPCPRAHLADPATAEPGSNPPQLLLLPLTARALATLNC